MEKIPDHPDIRAAERTGYPRRYHPLAVATCRRCGCVIWEDEPCETIKGRIYCELCAREVADE